VRIEVLFFDGCPSHEALLRAALDGRAGAAA
jgi:hypothetical protein